MRLYDLFEATPPDPLAPGDEIPTDVVDWKWLTEHTRQYRQYVNVAKKWLYRGMHNRPNAFHGRSRDDRRPESSHRGISMVFDYILSYHFNASALRLNSVFCTSDVNHAGNFGSQYVIFPLDGFRYTYTTQHDIVLHDLYQLGWQNWKFHKWIDQVIDQSNSEDNTNWLASNISSRLDDPYALFEQWLPQHAEELVGMGISRNLTQISLDQFFDLDHFKNQFQPQTTNLENALRDKVEVYIQGEYMALDLFTYAEKIEEHFKIEVS